MQTEFKREYHINEITSELKQVDIFTKMSFDEKNSELTIVTTIPRSSNSISVYIHNKTNKTDNQRMLTNLCIVEHLVLLVIGMMITTVLMQKKQKMTTIQLKNLFFQRICLQKFQNHP